MTKDFLSRMDAFLDETEEGPASSSEQGCVRITQRGGSVESIGPARRPDFRTAELALMAGDALGRLDAMLSALPSPLVAGFQRRMAISEAAALSRLEPMWADEDELALFLADVDPGDVASDRIGLATSQRIHDLLLLQLRRDPSSLWTQRRFLGASLVLPRRWWGHLGDLPESLKARLAPPGRTAGQVAAFLAEDRKRSWQEMHPVLGAARIIRDWHETGLANALGKPIGVTLAGVWLRRSLAAHCGIVPLGLGFMLRKGTYWPEDDFWPYLMIEALGAGAERALARLRWLVATERRCRETLAETDGPRRRSSSSLLPALTFLLGQPMASTTALARHLGLTHAGASLVLAQLREMRIVREVTGNKSHRIWTVA